MNIISLLVHFLEASNSDTKICVNNWEIIKTELFTKKQNQDIINDGRGFLAGQKNVVVLFSLVYHMEVSSSLL